MMYLLKRPVITEKNSLKAEMGIYAFEVDKKATKPEIKNAVEKAFRVKVSSVKTVICRKDGKRNRFGAGKVHYWKKALIKLAPGEKIAIFEGA